ncbi:cytochrome o ubiquinol oxidase subunit III [Sphingomonas sp. NFR15]|uniref:cytochrome o ubiquinol oxidase subunit III n=1 Tax=Sphingomonas sp. NFR15 TaxID=1566282 RepID=UPI00088CC62C|nr:cytochrome o ubiquinol oxidase subunit III [Sphingomonas sp. NFR15]SDA36806.1 cytochrome bb3 quinol oxidase subunit 3 [Sphingomonas sp. NFR15]
MTATTEWRDTRPPTSDPHRIGRGAGGGGGDRVTGHGAGGPADKRTVVGFGFWIFLLSDIVMFSAIFATYAVIEGATDGGPTARQLFDIDNAWVETVCLLFSSFTCGLATIAAERRSAVWTQVFLLATGLLGAVFLALELREFIDLIGRGAGPQRSAFLSGFFTLVGCHGLHVTAGLLWLGTMMAQVWTRGFKPNIARRLMCFSLFWHALDIIWVALFTIVYLFGVR